MRRFRFQFEALATVRKRAEDQAMRSLGAAQRAFQAAQDYKRMLLRDLEMSLIRRENLGSHPDGDGSSSSGTDFQLETSYITGIKQRIIQSDQAILRAQRSVEKALRTYLHARKQTRMIETLREKAYAEFKKARAKQEQKDLDDLNVMRARFRDQRGEESSA
jgi:flagellar export protein FliJ